MAQWLRICLPTQGTMINPRSGKIPRAGGHLSLPTVTTEPVFKSACCAARDATGAGSLQPAAGGQPPGRDQGTHASSEDPGPPAVINRIKLFFKSHGRPPEIKSWAVT